MHPVEFYILAAIHLAILCVYSSVLVLVIVCLDCLSVYIPDFTHNTLHSRADKQKSRRITFLYKIETLI